MQPIEIDQVVNGKPQSAVMPAVGTVPGPDVIVGELLDFIQYENGEVNGFVGLALGTDACNKGTENVGWFALPSNDHPFIPQNLYRMSRGATNNERFEQIGQSWGKHAFAAASSDTCGFGCNGVGGTRHRQARKRQPERRREAKHDGRKPINEDGSHQHPAAMGDASRWRLAKRVERDAARTRDGVSA